MKQTDIIIEYSRERNHQERLKPQRHKEQKKALKFFLLFVSLWLSSPPIVVHPYPNHQAHRLARAKRDDESSAIAAQSSGKGS